MNKKEDKKKSDTGTIIYLFLYNFINTLMKVVGRLSPYMLMSVFIATFLITDLSQDIFIKLLFFYAMFYVALVLLVFFAYCFFYLLAIAMKPYKIIEEEGVKKVYCHSEIRDFVKNLVKKDLRKTGFYVIDPNKENLNVKEKIVKQYKVYDLDEVFLLGVPLNFNRDTNGENRKNVITPYD